MREYALSCRDRRRRRRGQKQALREKIGNGGPTRGGRVDPGGQCGGWLGEEMLADRSFEGPS